MDSNFMSTKSYHNEDQPVKEEKTNTLTNTEYRYHALRVLPHLLSSLDEAGAMVIAWYSHEDESEVRVHVYNASELLNWGKQRMLQPGLSVRKDDTYPFEIYYHVNGIRVFAIVTVAEKEKLLPY